MNIPIDAGWEHYYRAVSGNPPRDTLVRALAAWEADHPQKADRIAVDLGCGEGRDTLALLARGFRVIAIDSEPAALDWLRRRPDLPAGARLETICARMEDAVWPAVDIVNASFALPFCAPDRFAALWARIADSLPAGGRFAGQLFGPRDDWAGPLLTICDRTAVDALLARFERDHFEEVDRPGKDALGTPKHWHLFHIAARKR
ncbi:MAG: trans-aconitate 2-methyltransferase [Rhodospirillales bacterium]